jgi:peptidoglycan-N-acetylglucosamine deacetylase
LKFRIVNIIALLLILTGVAFSVKSHPGAWVYWMGVILYLSVLFCGSYFIRWNFFFKSVNQGNTSEKHIALTFDDGPDPVNTLKILALLKERNAEAAFFCIGQKIPGNENLLQKIIQQDHIIGNHSDSHHVLFDLYRSSTMLADMQKMNERCREATGLSPRLFRPPYGVTNPNLKKAVEKGRFTSIGWSIRSLDTVIKDEKRLLNKILAALKPGGILLLHDTSATTLSILPELLEKIHEQGFKIIRLDKMLNLTPYA